MNHVEQFKAGRRAGAPLVAINTPDPAATMSTLMKTMNGSAPPAFVWDVVSGMRPFNESAKQALSKLQIDPNTTTNVVDCLGQAPNLPKGSVLFLLFAHRVIGELGVSQAIWNLRDEFKASKRTVVMLAPVMTLPAEIAGDVLVIEEKLPSPTELREILADIHKSAEVACPEDLTKAVEALAGIAAFPAEQAAAMSITKSGIDVDALWDRKRQMIRSTPGLSVYAGAERFSDIGGCENIKWFLGSILRGKSAPRCIVFMDEIEKAFAGVGTDTSGVSTEMTGQILSEMEDRRHIGAIFLGHPGAAKSAISKAAGNEVGIPTIQFDLSSMKGSLVGESTQRLKQALKVVESVSQGSALFLATCNSFGSLPPELKRRFTLGTFFFDLPTEEERELIWQLYCSKYKVGGERPDDEGWTGAEIRNCCDLAWRLGCNISTAARQIVPIARSAPEKIKSLREFASGRFISAATPGVYEFKTAGPSGRKIEV